MRALVTCVLVLAVTASTASAHGGTTLLDERAGPYRVLMQASPLAEAQTPGGTGAVDYTIGLQDAATRRPVSDATVTVAVDTGSGRRGPLTAEVVDGRYEVLMPRKRGERWNRWDATVTVSGSAGNARAEYEAPSSSAPPWLLYVTAALLPLSIAAFLLRVRERRLDAEDETPA